MNSQQKRLRKKKKREKIRKLHLKQAKADVDKVYVEAFERGLDKQISLGIFLPDRDDQDGWHKYGLYRSMRKTWDRAIEMFGNRDELVKLKIGKYDSKDLDYCMKIKWLLTAAAQSLCFDPPFFIPFFSFIKKVPQLTLIWAKNERRKDLWRMVGYEKKVVIGGKEYPVLLSTHCLWRLWVRANLGLNVLWDSEFYKRMFTFQVEYHSEEHLSLINTKKELAVVLGEHYPFGYCPYVRHEDFIVLTTFLLPGYHNTPENRVLGGRSDAKNVLDVSESEFFGMKTVADEAADALVIEERRRRYKKFSNYDFVKSIWGACEKWYKVPSIPDEFSK